MRLLICDDEHIIRNGLVALNWQSIGVDHVEMVDNGLDALSVIHAFHPDVVLADIRMPGLDGLSLAREISKNELDCKLIILSGYGTFEYARQALQNGVFEYLLKPSSPQEVLETVKRSIAGIQKKRTMGKEAELSAQKDSLVTVGDDTDRGILKYIEKNYMNDISLTMLAEHTHFSTSYLSRLIKKQTGYTFMQILGFMRMLKAAELLTATNLKIYVICEKIGINDQRYFSQLFRKTFGKTPMEYRKEKTKSFNGSLYDFLNG